MDPIAPDWVGVDLVMPLIDRVRRAGAVFIIKVDGERGEGDNGPYTVLASGGPLRGDCIRIDAETLEDGLAYVLVRYAERCWSQNP